MDTRRNSTLTGLNRFQLLRVQTIAQCLHFSLHSDTLQLDFFFITRYPAQEPTNLEDQFHRQLLHVQTISPVLLFSLDCGVLQLD